MLRYSVEDIVKLALDEIGLPVPANITSATDDDARQLNAVVRKAAAHIIGAEDWQDLTVDTFFLSKPAEDQGSIFTLFPDWNRFVENTIYNETQGRRIRGPASPQQWKQAKSGVAAFSAWQHYRVNRGNLFLLNQTVADERIVCQYVSNHCFIDATSGAASHKIEKATDICLLDGPLMVAAVQWLYLSALKLESKSREVEFNRLLDIAMGNNQQAGTVNLSAPVNQDNYFNYPYDVTVRV